MTSQDILLLNELYMRKTSFDELKERYSVSIDQDYILSELITAKKNRDKEAVFYLIMLAYKVGFNEKIGIELSGLLTEQWHIEHEEIARILQFKVNAPDCVDDVVKAIETKIEHLQASGDEESFIRKCVYVLSKLDTNYSRKKLIELSESSDLIVRNIVKEHLDEENQD